MACNKDKAPRIASATVNRAASSTDPATWRTYPEAVEAYGTGRFAGIGRVLTSPYVGIDIDSCVDPATGEITPEAWEIINCFNSYTEISPSGRGVKIWIRADLDYSRARGGLEIYRPHGRYFTVTGQIPAQGSGNIEDRQDELKAFIAKEFPEPERKRKPYEGNGFNGEFDLASWLEWHEVEILGYTPDDKGGIYSIVCPWVDEHSGGDTSGTKIGRAAVDGGTWFRCHHAHCAGRDYFDFRDKVAPRVEVRTRTADALESAEDFFRIYDEMPPFPVDAMPLKTRAFIRETAAAIDCPVDLVALPALATLSASLGHAREVQVKRGHTQTASIYAVGVAESGSGKTPAASIAQKPLKEMQRENGEDYARRKEIHEDAMRAHAVKVKRARKEETPEPKAPPKPVFERTWVDNATIEALAGLLEANPYGLALFQDELTGWLGGFDQYKAKGKGDTRQQFIRVWGGDTVTLDRKGDEEPIMIQRPYVTIYGSIQPRLIEEMGADREDGFINRFLMAYPEPHIAWETDNEISYAAEKSYEDLVRQLYMLRPTNSSDSSSGSKEKTPALVTFTRQAREVYKEHANRLAASAAEPGTPKTLRETYPKLRAYLARLSLLVATCRELEGGEDMEITPEDVLAAARLLEYFEAAARKAFHELASSDTETKNAFELSSLLKREGGYMVATAQEFRAALPSAPDTPEGTSKLLRKIARSTPRIILEDGWRGKERVLRISLLKRIVGTVGSVPVAEDPTLATPPAQDAGENWIEI